MGGIVADLHARSTLPGLYAVGESSCTGLHGANRLASNSLSECFVFARRAVASALSEPRPRRRRPAGRGKSSRRSARSHRLPRRRLHPRGALAGRRHRPLGRGTGAGCSSDPHPLARLIARCALARTESRGAHRRSDHPERDPAPRPSPRRRLPTPTPSTGRPGPDAALARRPGQAPDQPPARGLGGAPGDRHGPKSPS